MYVTSIGVIPKWRGNGWGSAIALWQWRYARRYKFVTLLLHTRESNVAMRKIALGIGYIEEKMVDPAYTDPAERAVEMWRFAT